MLQIQCAKCTRKLKVPLTAAGKTARCPCGETILVATPSNATGPIQPPEKTVAESTTNYTHGCDCGRKLRVPQSDLSKTAKCPCGKTFTIPARVQQATNPPGTNLKEKQVVKTRERAPSIRPQSEAFAANLPQGNSFDWANDLPLASPHLLPAATQSYAQDSVSSSSSSGSIANDYLKSAEREKRDKGKRESEGSGGGGGGSEELFGSSALYGVAMMIGAVLWFVVGLFFDRIFFYPPVMFVIGLIALVRGMFNSD